jgi:hypothetical protein
VRTHSPMRPRSDATCPVEQGNLKFPLMPTQSAQHNTRNSPPAAIMSQEKLILRCHAGSQCDILVGHIRNVYSLATQSSVCEEIDKNASTDRSHRILLSPRGPDQHQRSFRCLFPSVNACPKVILPILIPIAGWHLVQATFDLHAPQ